MFSSIQDEYKARLQREAAVRDELAKKEAVKDRLKDALSDEVQESLDIIDDQAAVADLSETLDDREMKDVEARRKAAAELRKKREQKKSGGILGLFKKKEQISDDDANIGTRYDRSYTNAAKNAKKTDDYEHSTITSETVISFDDDDEDLIVTPGVKDVSAANAPKEPASLKKMPSEPKKDNQPKPDKPKAEKTESPKKTSSSEAENSTSRTLSDGKTIARLSRDKKKYELVTGTEVQAFKPRLFKDFEAFVSYAEKHSIAPANA